MSDIVAIVVENPEQPIKAVLLPYPPGGGGGPLPDNIAYVDFPNVFTRENTIVGLRIGKRTVTSDFALGATDYEVVADASSGQITGALPDALGTGQIFRVKKKDSSPNVVIVAAQSGDLIDGDDQVILSNQFDGVTLIDAALGQWDNATRVSPFLLPPNIALRNAPNIFLDLNTFTGIRLASRTVTEDFVFGPLDFEVLVDATAGSVTGSLPTSTGNGQYYRAKKIDSTSNIVTIAADGGDLIDGSISLNFADQWADCTLLDAAIGYWDNTGSDASGGGGGGVDFGINGRVVDLNPIKGFAFEVFDGAVWVEQVRYTEPSSGPAPVAEVSFFYRPEIHDTTAVAAWPTVGVLVDSRLDARFTGKGLVSFILETGAADGGDDGQVAPDDYDAGTNDKHWTQML
jgi:hypothetical protein